MQFTDPKEAALFEESMARLTANYLRHSSPAIVQSTRALWREGASRYHWLTSAIFAAAAVWTLDHVAQYLPTWAEFLQTCRDLEATRDHQQRLNARALQAPDDAHLQQPPSPAERLRWEETMGQVRESLRRSSGPLRDDLATTAAQLHDPGRLAALPPSVDLREPTADEIAAAESRKAELQGQIERYLHGKRSKSLSDGGSPADGD